MRTEKYYRTRRNVRFIVWAALLGICTWVITYSLTEINRYSCTTASVVVGDNGQNTLWEIGTRNCVGNVARAVDALVETYGVTVYEGQNIFLPRNNGCQLRIDDGGDVWEDC
jgi:hypothetical protein